MDARIRNFCCPCAAGSMLICMSLRCIESAVWSAEWLQEVYSFYNKLQDVWSLSDARRFCKAAERMVLGGSEKGVNTCSSCLSSESSLQGSASMWLLSVSSDH